MYFNDAEMGFCARECAGTFDDACQETSGYGVEGLCRLRLQADSPEPTHCQVACELNNTVGECPPGLECLLQTQDEVVGSYKACYPIRIATGVEPSDCPGFCAKFINCTIEFGEEPNLTVAECEQGCVDENWKGQSCEQCWFTCDINANCSDFFFCFDECACEK
jgi:hypothetical protein